MAATLPFNDRNPITNPDGTPSQFFIRMLQERGFTLDGKITADQANALIAAWAAARHINTTAPITGGGTLATDLTLAHQTSGVTPGSYGDATHVAQITVNSTGHVTAATNVAILGGGGGGRVLINDTTLSSAASSVTVSSIPGTYVDLEIVVEARNSGTTAIDFGMQFNGDTGANYTYYVENRFGTATGTNYSRFGATNRGSDIANRFSPSHGYVFDYASTTKLKLTQSKGFYFVDNFEDRNSSSWNNTAAITQIVFLPSSSTFAAGTRFRVYGVA